MRGGGGNEVSGGRGKSGGMDGWGIKHYIRYMSCACGG